jgi:glycosyltransferase involved in cell wall biosynthesis
MLNESLPKNTHIGFDISQTGKNKAGCGFYAHALIKNLLNIAPELNYSLYPSFGDFYFDRFMPLTNQYKSGKYWPKHFFRQSSASFWNSDALEVKLSNPDIIHANNFWCPSKLKTTKLIYTLYDLGFLETPQWTTEANRLGCFSGVFKASLQADWIVAISKASKNHFLNTFPYYPEDRIKVIYPCSRFTDINIKDTKPEILKNAKQGEFWLSVGTIEPRKNQKRLALAYAKYVSKTNNPKPLVFAGGNGWLMGDFKAQINDLGIDKHVILTGYVSDEELIWLYKNCYANLYPTLFEGFGLPVLEGMQFGAPTVSSTTSSIPEVVGDAAKLLDPYDIDAWTDVMLDLDNNHSELEQMKSKSIIQANSFSWERSSQELLNLYAKALSEDKLYKNYNNALSASTPG